MSTYVVRSLEDWQPVLVELLPMLRPGVVLALSGPLGAGKTTFTQLLAKTLGIEGLPKSPTFGLMRVHSLPFAFQGVRRLIHVDAYRLEKESDVLALNLEEELVAGDACVVVEWPERMEAWFSRFPGSTVRLAIRLNEQEEREISLE